ncbi:unnamed protein product, partial [Protopolystoma xenopodis]
MFDDLPNFCLVTCLAFHLTLLKSLADPVVFIYGLRSMRFQLSAWFVCRRGRNQTTTSSTENGKPQIGSQFGGARSRSSRQNRSSGRRVIQLDSAP